MRRYENKLFITEAIQKKELMVGGAIRSVDDLDIATLAGLRKKELCDDIDERQN